jgi:hypothetical protein
MFKKSDHNSGGVVQSVMTAYLILILHVVLIALIGLLVIFFQGLISYMIWIFLGLVGVVAFSGYRFYRRLKAQGRSVAEAIRTPTFDGRPVEISFMGGLASLRLGESQESPALEAPISDAIPKQLEAPETAQVKELNDLAKLLEDGLITLEEFKNLKQQILNPQAAVHGDRLQP